MEFYPKSFQEIQGYMKNYDTVHYIDTDLINIFV